MTDYFISDLGSLQGEYLVPVAINESGVVAGHSINDRPFRWEKATLIELDTPSSTISAEVLGISSSQPERIVGWVYKGGSKRAVLWTDGVYTDLSTLTSKTLWEAWDVNDSGIVAGVADGGGFRLDMTTQKVEMILPPNGDFISGCAINKSGHVAGCTGASESQDTRLFFYDQTMHVVPNLEGIPWFGVRVNDADVIASSYATQGVLHAFTYDFKSKVFTDIHGAAFTGSSIAFDFNNHGVVVGMCNAYESDMAGMIWTASDGMRRLNDVVDMQSGWIFRNAAGINDAGQITGWGTFYGQPRGFLLTPVGERGKQQPKDLVGMVKEILFSGGGMGILLPSGDVIYPKDGPVDPDSPLQRRDAARSDAAIGLAMQVLAQRISDRSTRALAEKAAVEITQSAAASAGSARTAAGRSNWLSRLVRDIADELER